MPVVPTHHYRQTYSDADLAQLAQEFDIPHDHRAELASLLEDAAAIWRWYDTANTDRVAPFHAAKALREVAKQAGKLKIALEALPEPARVALAMQQADVAAAIIMGKQDTSSLPYLTVPESDGSESPIFHDLGEMTQLISSMAQMATQASDIPRRWKGKPADQGLWVWISNIDAFWTSTLGRSFARDVGPNGEPISEAGLFCAAAFRFVSPKTPQNSVLNAMKKHISSVNRKSLAK